MTHLSEKSKSGRILDNSENSLRYLNFSDGDKAGTLSKTHQVVAENESINIYFFIKKYQMVIK